MSGNFRLLRVIGLVASLLLVVGARRTSAITYTTLDDPLGPGTTVATGISGGNIVGYYSVGNNAPSRHHGFLYNGSTYTPIDDPQAGPSGTTPLGIFGGNIVGYYTVGNNDLYG